MVGNLVREKRKLFLHKGAWPKFKGYAYSQLPWVSRMLIILVAIVYPTALTFLYFDLLANAPTGVQQGVYALGKVLLSTEFPGARIALADRSGIQSMRSDSVLEQIKFTTRRKPRIHALARLGHGESSRSQWAVSVRSVRARRV